MLKYRKLEAPTGAVSVKAAAFGPQGYVIHHGDALALEGSRRVYLVAVPNDYAEYALLDAMEHITPEAGDPLGLLAEREAIAAGEPATGGGASSQITPLEPRLHGIRDPERDDDEGEPVEVTRAFPSGVDRD